MTNKSNNYIDLKSANNSIIALFNDLEKSNQLIQAIPDLIFIVNKEGKILFVKFENESDLAFPLNEIIEKKITDLPFSDDLKKKFMLYINKAFKSGLTELYNYSLETEYLKGYYEARCRRISSKEVLVLIRNKTEEEIFKLKIIESEKRLKQSVEEIAAQNEEYITINEEYQKANDELIKTNLRIETLLRELKAKEYRLSQIVDNSPAGIFTFNNDLVITSVNQSFLKGLGINEKDLIGYNIFNIEDTSILSCLNLALKGKQGMFEGWYKPLNEGNSFYVTITTIPLYDVNRSKKIIGGTAIVNNLTLWKNTTQKLQEQEENLYVTLNSIGDGVIATNIKGNITFINPVAQRLTGYGEKESLSKNIKDVFNIINNETKEPIANPIFEVVKTSNKVGLSNHTVLVSNNGDKYHISHSAAPIKTEDGKMVGVVLVFQDITDSYYLQQKIIASEHLYKKLVNNSPTGIMLINSEGQIIEINKQIVSILGSPSIEATQAINVLKFQPLIDVGFAKDFDKCFKTKELIINEGKYLTKWGKNIFVKYYLVPIELANDKKGGILCTIIDITEQKIIQHENDEYYKQLNMISDTAISFVELPETEDPFTLIAKKLKNIISSSFIILSFNDIQKKYEIKFNYFNKIEKAESSILLDIFNKHKVFDLFKKSQKPASIITEVTSSLKKIIKQEISSKQKEQINYFFNEYKLLVIDFVWQGMDYGSVMFIQHNDLKIANNQFIETFINQSSLLLQKRYSAIKLRQSKDLHLTSINSIKDNFFIVNRNYEMVFMNYSMQKIVSRYVGDFDVTGHNIFKIFKFLPERMLNEYKIIFEEKNEYFSEYEINDGEIKFYIDVTTVPLIEDNEVIYAITSFRDVTEQKIRENEINKLKEFNENIVQNLNDGIAIIKDDNCITFVNPAFCKITGFYRNEILNKKWTDLIIDLPLSDFTLPISPYVNDKVFRTEALIKTRNKSETSVIITLSPLSHNKDDSYMLLVTDISDRKLMEKEIIYAKEQAEQADRLKTSFLANMSHEIRTPINSILGFSTLLQKSDLPEDKKTMYFSLINSSSQLLLRLIEDIIDISKIESGLLQIFNEPIDLNELINDVYDYFSANLKSNNKNDIFIKCNSLKNDSIIIMSDRLRLKQVLFNLLSNAIKFTNKGYIEFGYNIDINKIVFYVKDTGIGMTSEEINIIFDRFRQVNTHISRKTSGTGLGLAISKSIVELLGGNIYCESEKGKGSVFYFELPYITSKTNILKQEKEIDLDNYQLVGYTILVAEDDDMNFLFISEILKSFGINVIRAKNGREAVNICLNNTKISAVLMDIQMPELDGLEATKEIRKFLPDIPILAQTAYAFSREKQTSIEVGCNDYLSKPIDPDILIYKLIMAIKHSK